MPQIRSPEWSLGSGCLTLLSIIFQLYRGDQFYWWKKPTTWKKPPTCHKSLTNFYHIMCQVHLAWTGFELALVVIGTDYIGSCKFNYHMITTMSLMDYSHEEDTFMEEIFSSIIVRGDNSSIFVWSYPNVHYWRSLRFVSYHIIHFCTYEKLGHFILISWMIRPFHVHLQLSFEMFWIWSLIS